jgi:hypothetical protein
MAIPEKKKPAIQKDTTPRGRVQELIEADISFAFGVEGNVMGDKLPDKLLIGDSENGVPGTTIVYVIPHHTDVEIFPRYTPPKFPRGVAPTTPQRTITVQPLNSEGYTTVIISDEGINTEYHIYQRQTATPPSMRVRGQLPGTTLYEMLRVPRLPKP